MPALLQHRVPVATRRRQGRCGGLLDGNEQVGVVFEGAVDARGYRVGAQGLGVEAAGVAADLGAGIDRRRPVHHPVVAKAPVHRLEGRLARLRRTAGAWSRVGPWATGMGI